MSKMRGKTTEPAALKRAAKGRPTEAEFDEVLDLIDAAKRSGRRLVNTALIDLYWNIGGHQPEDRGRRLGPGDGRGAGRRPSGGDIPT